jgi:hypothetical protein
MAASPLRGDIDKAKTAFGMMSRDAGDLLPAADGDIDIKRIQLNQAGDPPSALRR